MLLKETSPEHLHQNKIGRHAGRVALAYRHYRVGAQMVKICLQCRRHGFDPWVGKIPWRREWQPTQVFMPGESHRQKSLVGYSPWGRKESDN